MSSFFFPDFQVSIRGMLTPFLYAACLLSGEKDLTLKSITHSHTSRQPQVPLAGTWYSVLLPSKHSLFYQETRMKKRKNKKKVMKKKHLMSMNAYKKRVVADRQISANRWCGGMKPLPACWVRWRQQQPVFSSSISLNYEGGHAWLSQMAVYGESPKEAHKQKAHAVDDDLLTDQARASLNWLMAKCDTTWATGGEDAS